MMERRKTSEYVYVAVTLSVKAAFIMASGDHDAFVVEFTIFKQFLIYFFKTHPFA